MTEKRKRIHQWPCAIAICLLLTGGALTAPASAAAQGFLAVDDVQSAELPPGEVHEWILDLEAVQSLWLVANSQQDLAIPIFPPDRQSFTQIDGSMTGEEAGGFQAHEAGTRALPVNDFDGAQTSYSRGWSLAEEGAFDNMQEGPSQTAPSVGYPYSMGSGQQGVLDAALDLLAHSVFPFLALLAMQSIAVFFVRHFMMRPSKAGAEEITGDAEEGARRAPGSGKLAFLTAGTANGVVLTGDSYKRYLHSLRAAKETLLGFFWVLIGFLLVSALVGEVAGVLASDDQAASGPLVSRWVVVAQAVLALILLIVSIGRHWSTGNPISTGYAVFAVLVLVIPAAVAAASSGSWLSLAMWPLAPMTLWLLLRRRGRLASELGKQDLLVLRVFGADANAASTFGTLARAWRYLGPTITIADPSYVRYEFAATARGNLLKTTLVSVAFGVAAMGFFNLTVRSFLSSLPGLSGLTGPQLYQVGIMATIVILLPIAVLPVFISVWRNFTKDRAVLLQRIRKVMGAKMRWNGVYQRRPFYCYDDLWRPAVQEMMREAEIVLMDFRGFDPSNLGCEYEIGKVLDLVPIHRVVVLLDERTDHEGIFQIFRDRWADLAPYSPNLSSVAPTLKVFTAHPFVSRRDGIWRWLKSLSERKKRWQEDAERVLAFVATAPAEPGATPIP